jgi:hypothetical protein
VFRVPSKPILIPKREGPSCYSSDVEIDKFHEPDSEETSRSFSSIFLLALGCSVSPEQEMQGNESTSEGEELGFPIDLPEPKPAFPKISQESVVKALLVASVLISASQNPLTISVTQPISIPESKEEKEMLHGEKTPRILLDLAQEETLEPRQVLPVVPTRCYSLYDSIPGALDFLSSK